MGEGNGSMRRFLSWLGGSFLLYVLGDPIREQIIDPLLAPLHDSGNAAVAFLLRPIAVLVVPLVVSAGVVVLAARAAPGRVGWPRPLRLVAAGLVAVFLAATLWASLAGSPGFTHLATTALVLVAVLFLERTSWVGGGRGVGPAGTVLALAALQYAVSLGKAGAGLLEVSIRDAAGLDLAAVLVLGTVFCVFGLAVLLDSRPLLIAALAGACVPMTAWSAIGFLLTDRASIATAYVLVTIALATATAALRGRSGQAPGIAGVIGGISGRAGATAALCAGCACLVLAVTFLAGVVDYYPRFQVAYGVGLAVLGLAFLTCAAALVTGRRALMGTAGLLIGLAFAGLAATDAVAGVTGVSDTDYTLARYYEWELQASAQALASAAFLVAGVGLLIRRFDSRGRLAQWVIGILNRRRL